MKLKPLFFCLIAMLPGLLMSAKYDSDKKKGGLHDCITLTEKDFTHDGRVDKPLVIEKSGKYCLGETINWDPKCRNHAAIIINANDVYLDLRGHELIQVNKEERAIGVLVTTGHHTISIVNGTVRNFTQLGIVVEGGTSNIFLGNDDTFLKVICCGFGSKYAFKDCKTDDPILQGGILLGQSKALESRGYYNYHGVINTARLVNVFAEHNSPTGMYLGVGTDITVQKSIFSRNSDTRKAGHSNPIAIGDAFIDKNAVLAIGAIYSASCDFGDIHSVSIEFDNCSFDENKAVGDTPVAFGLDAGYNIDGLTVRQCTFNANIGREADNSNGFGVYGCLLGGNHGVLVEDCEAVDNFSDYYTSGFHHSGRNLSFSPETMTPGRGLVYRSCNSVRNIAHGSQGFVGAVGFEFYFMDGLTVENCTSIDNEANSQDPATKASVQGIILGGFQRLNGPLKDVLVTGCHIAGNKVSGSGDIEGILVFGDSQNIAVKDSVIQNNRGAGFDVGIWTLAFENSALSQIVVQNSTIEDEDIGIYSGGDSNSIFELNAITDTAFGILLDGSSCDALIGNKITNSFLVGIEDTSVPSTSYFENNTVFNATTAAILPARAIEINNRFATGNPVCRGGLAQDRKKAKEAIKKNAANTLVHAPTQHKAAFGFLPKATKDSKPGKKADKKNKSSPKAPKKKGGA